MQLLVIGLGGFVGALARHGLADVVQRGFPARFPAGTLVVNLLGCLAIGLAMGVFEQRAHVAETTRLLVLTGFLGSFTTFSTFGWGTFGLLREGHVGLALLNVGGHLLLGLAAVGLGYAAAR